MAVSQLKNLFNNLSNKPAPHSLSPTLQLQPPTPSHPTYNLSYPSRGSATPTTKRTPLSAVVDLRDRTSFDRIPSTPPVRYEQAAVVDLRKQPDRFAPTPPNMIDHRHQENPNASVLIREGVAVGRPDGDFKIEAGFINTGSSTTGNSHSGDTSSFPNPTPIDSSAIASAFVVGNTYDDISNNENHFVQSMAMKFDDDDALAAIKRRNLEFSGAGSTGQRSLEGLSSRSGAGRPIIHRGTHIRVMVPAEYFENVKLSSETLENPASKLTNHQKTPSKISAPPRPPPPSKRAEGLKPDPAESKPAKTPNDSASASSKQKDKAGLLSAVGPAPKPMARKDRKLKAVSALVPSSYRVDQAKISNQEEAVLSKDTYNRIRDWLADSASQPSDLNSSHGSSKSGSKDSTSTRTRTDTDRSSSRDTDTKRLRYNESLNTKEGLARRSLGTAAQQYSSYRHNPSGPSGQPRRSLPGQVLPVRPGGQRVSSGDSGSEWSSETLPVMESDARSESPEFTRPFPGLSRYQKQPHRTEYTRGQSKVSSSSSKNPQAPREPRRESVANSTPNLVQKSIPNPNTGGPYVSVVYIAPEMETNAESQVDGLEDAIKQNAVDRKRQERTSKMQKAYGQFEEDTNANLRRLIDQENKLKEKASHSKTPIKSHQSMEESKRYTRDSNFEEEELRRRQARPDNEGHVAQKNIERRNVDERSRKFDADKSFDDARYPAQMDVTDRDYWMKRKNEKSYMSDRGHYMVKPWDKRYGDTRMQSSRRLENKMHQINEDSDGGRLQKDITPDVKTVEDKRRNYHENISSRSKIENAEESVNAKSFEGPGLNEAANAKSFEGPRLKEAANAKSFEGPRLKEAANAKSFEGPRLKEAANAKSFEGPRLKDKSSSNLKQEANQSFDSANGIRNDGVKYLRQTTNDNNDRTLNDVKQLDDIDGQKRDLKRFKENFKDHRVTSNTKPADMQQSSAQKETPRIRSNSQDNLIKYAGIERRSPEGSASSPSVIHQVKSDSIHDETKIAEKIPSGSSNFDSKSQNITIRKSNENSKPKIPSANQSNQNDTAGLKAVMRPEQGKGSYQMQSSMENIAEAASSGVVNKVAVIENLLVEKNDNVSSANSTRQKILSNSERKENDQVKGNSNATTPGKSISSNIIQERENSSNLIEKSDISNRFDIEPKEPPRSVEIAVSERENVPTGATSAGTKKVPKSNVTGEIFRPVSSQSVESFHSFSTEMTDDDDAEMIQANQEIEGDPEKNDRNSSSTHNVISVADTESRSQENFNKTSHSEAVEQKLFLTTKSLSEAKSSPPISAMELSQQPLTESNTDFETQSQLISSTASNHSDPVPTHSPAMIEILPESNPNHSEMDLLQEPIDLTHQSVSNQSSFDSRTKTTGIPEKRSRPNSKEKRLGDKMEASPSHDEKSGSDVERGSDDSSRLSVVHSNWADKVYRYFDHMTSQESKESDDGGARFSDSQTNPRTRNGISSVEENHSLRSSQSHHNLPTFESIEIIIPEASAVRSTAADIGAKDTKINHQTSSPRLKGEADKSKAYADHKKNDGTYSAGALSVEIPSERESEMEESKNDYLAERVEDCVLPAGRVKQFRNMFESGAGMSPPDEVPTVSKSASLAYPEIDTNRTSFESVVKSGGPVTQKMGKDRFHSNYRMYTRATTQPREGPGQGLLKVKDNRVPEMENIRAESQSHDGIVKSPTFKTHGSVNNDADNLDNSFTTEYIFTSKLIANRKPSPTSNRVENVTYNESKVANEKVENKNNSQERFSNTNNSNENSQDLSTQIRILSTSVVDHNISVKEDAEGDEISEVEDLINPPDMFSEGCGENVADLEDQDMADVNNLVDNTVSNDALDETAASSHENNINAANSINKIDNDAHNSHTSEAKYQQLDATVKIRSFESRRENQVLSKRIENVNAPVIETDEPNPEEKVLSSSAGSVAHLIACFSNKSSKSSENIPETPRKVTPKTPVSNSAVRRGINYQPVAENRAASYNTESLNRSISKSSDRNIVSQSIRGGQSRSSIASTSSQPIKGLRSRLIDAEDERERTTNSPSFRAVTSPSSQASSYRLPEIQSNYIHFPVKRSDSSISTGGRSQRQDAAVNSSLSQENKASSVRPEPKPFKPAGVYEFELASLGGSSESSLIDAEDSYQTDDGNGLLVPPPTAFSNGSEDPDIFNLSLSPTSPKLFGASTHISNDIARSGAGAGTRDLTDTRHSGLRTGQGKHTFEVGSHRQTSIPSNQRASESQQNSATSVQYERQRDRNFNNNSNLLLTTGSLTRSTRRTYYNRDSTDNNDNEDSTNQRDFEVETNRVKKLVQRFSVSSNQYDDDVNDDDYSDDDAQMEVAYINPQGAHQRRFTDQNSPRFEEGMDEIEDLADFEYVEPSQISPNEM